MTYDPRACGALCGSCPLQGSQVVPPEGNPDARIAIVSEVPSAFEIKFGKQFVGPHGAKLNELLYKAGIARQSVFLTSSLLCKPEVPDKTGRRRWDVKEWLAWWRRENVKTRRANTARTKEAKKTGTVPELMPEMANPFECCAPRLQAELNWLDVRAKAAGAPNGLVVVPLGSFALGALMSKPGASQSVTKYRGSVLFPPAKAAAP